MLCLYLMVGLGNPGREYARTRHNIGFWILDLWAERIRSEWTNEAKLRSLLARGEWEERRLLLCKPQTYMNASGQAVQMTAAYYRVDLANLLVVVDDADLPYGEIRLRPNGGAGGHHGLESIEQHLGSKNYARLRVGIGRQGPGQREITHHVLGNFTAEESAHLPAIGDRVIRQMACWLTWGIQKAMSDFNGVIEPPKTKES